MKNILLTSTALVAFAGAAVADGHTSVTHVLGATLGFTKNDNVGSTDLAPANVGNDFGEDGFFWEGNLKTTATSALDNGLTAKGYFEITIATDDGVANSDGGNALTASDFVLSLESDTASVFLGDTETAAATRWKSAGDMEADGFSSGLDSSVLRGDVSLFGVDASVSYIVDDASNTAEQLSVGAGATFGAVSLSAAYQEESKTYVDTSGDFNAKEVMGVSASGTFANATVTLAYAATTATTAGEDNKTSIGGKISYPLGPVTLAAYFVQEAGGATTAATFEKPNYGVNVAYASGPITVKVDYQDDQETTKYAVDATYDLGNGLSILAGALNENEGDDVDFYAGGKFALGAGATASVVYAADKDGDQADEIAGGEFDAGITVKVDFTF